MASCKMKSVFRWVPTFFLASVFILSVFSCVTTEVYQGYIPDLDEATVSRLETLLADDDPLQVLQDIDMLKRSRETTEPLMMRIEGLEEEALKRLQADFDEALRDERYLEAASLLHALSIVKEGDSGMDITEESLLFSAAMQEVAEGRKLAGIMMFLEAASKSEPSTEEIYYFGDIALEEGNRRAMVKITEILTEREIPVPEEYRQYLSRGVSKADMINGTVTIWVNRGMRLEGGVGYPERVIGSGFFIDNSGYIITNYHVISSEVDPEYEGYSRLYVRLPENPQMKVPARVVGWSRIFDIALLKTELQPEHIFMFEEGVTSSPGDKIFAIGSPAGLESTITSGIVSAKNRELLQMGDAIQVDVPINQGNSGGPILDDEGRLLGVVFAGIEQFEGVNFGIPSEWIIDIVPELYRGGDVALPWIGVMAIKADEGLEVIYVVPGSPAYRAGLEAGDVITQISGETVKLLREAHHTLLEYSPDMLIDLAWLRGDERVEGIIKLSSRPFRPLETALERDVRENLLVPLFGMRVEKSGKTGFEQNYIITKVYSGFTADETGLSPNDPFSIRNWIVEKEDGYAAVQIRVKKRKAGFLESVIQIATYLETANFM